MLALNEIALRHAILKYYTVMNSLPGLDHEFSGKKVLVVGGTHGLGLACGIAFASAGSIVTLIGRRIPEISLETKKMFLHPIRHISINFNDIDWRNKLNNGLAGDYSFDILINAIGGSFGSQTDSAIETYESVMNLNFFIPLQMTDLVLPTMLGSLSGGRIIFFGTLAVRQLSASAPYVASKSALMSYFKIKAHEVAVKNPKVILSSISPGLINVPGKFINSLLVTGQKSEIASIVSKSRIAASRPGEVSEVVSCVMFICSSMGSYLHGAELNIDGGAL